MLRIVSFVLGVVIVAVASFTVSNGWALGSVESFLMIIGIISFAVMTTGWAINRDV